MSAPVHNNFARFCQRSHFIAIAKCSHKVTVAIQQKHRLANTGLSASSLTVQSTFLKREFGDSSLALELATISERHVLLVQNRPEAGHCC